MKLPAYQLSEHLKKNLLPIYIVAGDEPLLIQEARDAIRETAQKCGFSDRQYFETSKDFDWQMLLEAMNNLSLFASKSIIELKLSGKPGVQGGKILIKYAETLPSDKILLIISNKLDQATQKTVWFQTLIKQGVFIPIWPMEFAQFMRWIQQRFQQAGISTSPDGIRLIAEYTEGNLLATAQEIMKLQLLYPGQNISASQIKDAISDHTRYDIFVLVDEALKGDAKKALKILRALQQEGVELPLILWSISKELRTLINLQQMMNSGISLENAFKKFQIWEKRQITYKTAMQKHRTSDLHQLLIRCSQIDGQIKGIIGGNPWDEMSQLLLRLCEIKFTSPYT